MTPSRGDRNDEDDFVSTKVIFTESHCKDVELVHEQSLMISVEESDKIHGY